MVEKKLEPARSFRHEFIFDAFGRACQGTTLKSSVAGCAGELMRSKLLKMV